MVARVIILVLLFALATIIAYRAGKSTRKGQKVRALKVEVDDDGNPNVYILKESGEWMRLERHEEDITET